MRARVTLGFAAALGDSLGDRVTAGQDIAQEGRGVMPNAKISLPSMRRSFAKARATSAIAMSGLDSAKELEATGMGGTH